MSSWGPLVLASQNGNLEIVNLLLLDIRPHPENALGAALAYLQPSIEVVERILADPRITIYCKEIDRAFRNAIIKEDLNLIKLLLESDAAISLQCIYENIKHTKNNEIKKTLLSSLSGKLVKTQPLLAFGLFSNSGADEIESCYILNKDLIHQITSLMFD